MRPFVVTGSGRCGTAWMARALSHLGYSCGHEVVFSPYTLSGRWQALLDRRRCDSSWLALAVLGQLPADTVVVQVVRNPLDVARSLAGIRFFETPNTYRDVAISLMGEPATAARWWQTANRIASARANLIVRIEDDPLDLLSRVLAAVDPDREVSPRLLRSAAYETPMLNSRARDLSVEFTDDELQQLRADAARYGYEL